MLTALILEPREQLELGLHAIAHRRPVALLGLL
jgi:hypothetical protein